MIPIVIYFLVLYYRQIQCNKDNYKFSFFCQTIKDWNKLSLDITKNTTTESFKGALTHDVLLDTYPYLKFLLLLLTENHQRTDVYFPAHAW
jgi:hypothetical protein